MTARLASSRSEELERYCTCLIGTHRSWPPTSDHRDASRAAAYLRAQHGFGDTAWEAKASAVEVQVAGSPAERA